MVKLFKGMFDSSSQTETLDHSPSYQDFVLVDWYDEGKSKAQNHGASEAGLITCIGKIYHNHKEILRKDEIEQEKAKQPYRVKLKEYMMKNEVFHNRIEKIKNVEVPKIEEKIENLQEEIREIRKNPEQFIGDKVGKAGFIVGLIILAFLTVYLFIFYSSASFSAFFKEFSVGELGVVNSIFDPKALTTAYQDGFTELILILTIPFVFLGLGYLIHKFQEVKGWGKYLKITMLVAVTFIFDCILAYEITEKIYNIKAENSFDDVPPYTVAMAFQSVNFWLIIFAGFVVYLIWGFVFDFVMEAYGKLDQLSVIVNAKKEEIAKKEEQLQKLDDETNKLSYLMGTNNTEMEKLKTILEHSEIIKPKELEHSLMRFLDGWLEFLNFNNRGEADRQHAHSLVSEFINVNVRPVEALTQEHEK
jgi:tetrahydromethanopterin S-methyltransferase subunit G